MPMHSRVLAMTVAGAALLLGACTNTIKYDVANRPSVVKTEFNVTDLQSMVGNMTENMLTHPSVLSYTLAKRPSLAVDTLINLTGREIGVSVASNDMLEKLIAADSFRVLGSDSVRNARSRAGLAAGQAIDDKAIAWSMAKTLSADLLLYGEVSEVIRAKATAKDVFYRVDLRLLDRKTGGIAWQDQKEFLKSQKKTIYGL
jgi:uncharacterized protein (TIGR02722 family)